MTAAMSMRTAALCRVFAIAEGSRLLLSVSIRMERDMTVRYLSLYGRSGLVVASISMMSFISLAVLG